MELKMSKYYKILAVFTLLLFFLMSYISLLSYDFYDKEVENGGTIIEQKEENITGNHVLYSEGLEQTYFYPGEYILTVEAITNFDDAYFEIIDIETNTILGSSFYDKNADKHTLQFSTNHLYSYIKTRSYIPSKTSDDNYLNISSYRLQSLRRVYKDAEFFILFLSIYIISFIYSIKVYISSGRKDLLALLSIAGIISLPFLSNGIYNSDDFPFHISRIFSIAKALEMHRVPLYITELFSESPITPILYPELILYGAGFMCALGASIPFGYNALCIFINFLTVFIAYYSFKQIRDEKDALLFSFIYAMNPFRLNELFVRGAIGEAFGMAFFPLIAIGMLQIVYFKKDFKKGALNLILGYTGLISSHVIFCLMSAIFCIFIILLDFIISPLRFIKNIKNLLWIFLSAIAVILLNLWFLIPFLQFSGLNTFIHGELAYNSMAVLSLDMWGLFFDSKLHGAGFIILSALILLGIITIKNIKNKTSEALLKKEDLIFCSFLSGLAIIFLYMSSNLFPWLFIFRNFEFLQSTLGKMQFPWRFLAISVCLFCMVLALIVKSLLSNKKKSLLGLVLLSICFISFINASLTFRTGKAAFDKYSSDFFYERDYLLFEIDHDKIKEVLFDGKGPVSETAGITDYKRSGTDYEFSFINTNGDSEIIVPVFWYGLSEAKLKETGESLEILPCDKLQFTKILVPSTIKEGTVIIGYQYPYIWVYSLYISLTTLLILLIIFILRIKIKSLRS